MDVQRRPRPGMNARAGTAPRTRSSSTGLFVFFSLVADYGGITAKRKSGVRRPQTPGRPLSISLRTDLFYKVRNIGEETIQWRALGGPRLRDLVWHLPGIVDHALYQSQPFPQGKRADRFIDLLKRHRPSPPPLPYTISPTPRIPTLPLERLALDPHEVGPPRVQPNQDRSRPRSAPSKPRSAPPGPGSGYRDRDRSGADPGRHDPDLGAEDADRGREHPDRGADIPTAIRKTQTFVQMIPTPG